MQTETFPALEHFKLLLTPAAVFTYRFEPPIISGNTSPDQLDEVVEVHTVSRLTDKAVFFRAPSGTEVKFVFPPAAELSRVGASFVWTNSHGRRVLSYTPRGL